MKIWFDHGVNPQNGSYIYMVFPGISESELKSLYVSGTPYSILSNTKELQAVKNKEEQEVQAVFYQSGNLLLENKLNLKMDSAGIILLQLLHGKVHSMSISDPTRKLKEITFTLDGLYKVLNKNISAIKNKQSNTTFLPLKCLKKNMQGKVLPFNLNSQYKS